MDELVALEKEYTDLQTSLTLKQVKKKAMDFYEKAQPFLLNLEDDDYWIQLSKEWDLNITEVWHWETEHHLCLYKVKRDKQGNFITDTLDEFISI
jgi:hypothetical protein